MELDRAFPSVPDTSADPGADDLNHERALCLWYVANVARSTVPPGDLLPVVAGWLRNHRGLHDIAIPDDGGELEPPPARRRRRSTPMIHPVDPALRRHILSHLPQGGAAPLQTRDAVARNIDLLSEEFGLDPIERELLCLLVRCQRIEAVGHLVEAVNGVVNSVSRSVAVLLGVDGLDVHRRILPQGRLARSGLLAIDHDGACVTGDIGYLNVCSSVARILGRPYASVDDLRRDLLGQPVSGELDWNDFAHVADARDLAVRVLAGALEARTTGINILVYGPPGTGKTEFCRALGARLGAALFAVGETDEDGDEPSRAERIGTLRFAQRLLQNARRSLVLFDEMEDLLSGPVAFSPRSGSSKVFVHRLLETNATPTLWTANNIHAFDPAILRRFTLAIEMAAPSVAVRRRVWERRLKREGMTVTEAAVARLAREIDAPPGIAANAIRAVKLAAGGEEDLLLAARGLARVTSSRVSPATTSHAEAFAPDLVRADADLARLTERLASAGRVDGLSLCLYGPPGTGKSAFVRHLADRLGLPVVQKRASDLLSKWIGETEERIAAAFAEAREDGAFLVFDEADSLLADRRDAARSWEVSQVNEMLTWMESHPLPFACTTNLMERLDAAALRRFTLKVRFDFLVSDQLRRAFELYFGLDAPPAVQGFEALAPGDFAVVRRKARLLGCADDPNGLVDLLRQEQEAKGVVSRRIGFAVGR